MQILITIVPIFTIVILGWVAQKKGFMPPSYLTPANRLVFYIAIPAMIFRAITKSTLTVSFSGGALPLTLLAAITGYLIAFLIAYFFHSPTNRRGPFVQCSAHGNLGYIGLAVAFYYLGDKGLSSASIIAGCLMIVQNMLSVTSLQFFSEKKGHRHSYRENIKKILLNPVILSAISGITVSMVHLKIPLVIERTLDILSGLALPTALLIIGASISLKQIKKRINSLSGVVLIKLIILPGTGILLFKGFHLLPEDYLPGLILLSSPTATIAYVMGREMGGDTDFAAAAISATTLVSSLTLTIWLTLAAY